jgi:hypothetical protein
MSHHPGGDPPLAQDLAAGEPADLANEFAHVRVRVVQTHNGVRLEILAPKLGRAIRLDPVELETLTWQTHQLFSELLRTPFGPEPEADAE